MDFLSLRKLPSVMVCTMSTWLSWCFPECIFLYSSKLELTEGGICLEVGSHKWNRVVRWRQKNAEVLAVSRLSSLYLFHNQLSFLIAYHVDYPQSKAYHLIFEGESTCQLPTGLAMNFPFSHMGAFSRDSGFNVLA